MKERAEVDNWHPITLSSTTRCHTKNDRSYSQWMIMCTIGRSCLIIFCWDCGYDCQICQYGWISTTLPSSRHNRVSLLCIFQFTSLHVQWSGYQWGLPMAVILKCPIPVTWHYSIDVVKANQHGPWKLCFPLTTVCSGHSMMEVLEYCMQRNDTHMQTRLWSWRNLLFPQLCVQRLGRQNKQGYFCIWLYLSRNY